MHFRPLASLESYTSSLQRMYRSDAYGGEHWAQKLREALHEQYGRGNEPQQARKHSYMYIAGSITCTLRYRASCVLSCTSRAAVVLITHRTHAIPHSSSSRGSWTPCAPDVSRWMRRTALRSRRPSTRATNTSCGNHARP